MPRKPRTGPAALVSHGFLRSVRLVADGVSSFDEYPFSIPAVRQLEAGWDLDAKVTFLVGENGSGKSTLLEALAVATGYNPEGGSRNFRFATRHSESGLAAHLRVARGVRRPRDGFFLRAESFYNAATYIEEADREPSGPRLIDAYGGKSLHEVSHGESFLALAQHRFRGDGLYLLDEPEAALSPARQLSLLRIMHRLVERQRSQLVVATHSPLLLAYPGALVYELGASGLRAVDYGDLEHVRLTRDFLLAPERYLKHLFADDDAEDAG